ncbi:MAG: hypothetical protein PSV23_13795 [Brevundimonas sp.]|uniref:hypothetical protein n=1 Tax=Brevundimonas sp. TaxID=1871086 RepID=UPI0024896F7A|nr:hypothetical protein [Brevundimonas sp.]MDI1327858.1 hypothetical protein [Brevundimonas sp.]
MFFPVALFASLVLQQQTPPAAQIPAPAPAQASAAAPQTEPATLPTVNVAATPAEAAQTCRMEAVTGSRFGRRVCRNNVQTAEEAAQSREMLRRMQGSRMPDG